MNNNAHDNHADGTPILELMAGRLPAIVVECRKPGEDLETLLASGWFVEDEGILFLVTAAHFWVEEVIARSKAVGRACVRILDTESHGTTSVTLGESSELTSLDLHHPAGGLDFTMLAIPALHAATLQAHPGFVPFTRETMALDVGMLPNPEEWHASLDVGTKPPEGAEISATYLLGYPSSSLQRGREALKLTPQALGVLGECPREELEELVTTTSEYPIRHDWDYLRIASMEHLPEDFTVKGMSGGPIVFVVDGTVFVAGTQTLWWPQAAVVGTQPVHLVAQVLDNWREFRRAQEAEHAE